MVAEDLVSVGGLVEGGFRKRGGSLSVQTCACRRRLFTAVQEYVVGGVGGLGSGIRVSNTHTVYSERDVPQLRPVTSLPSGSRHGRQTQLLLGLEEEVCGGRSDRREVEDGMWDKNREKRREENKMEKR